MERGRPVSAELDFAGLYDSGGDEVFGSIDEGFGSKGGLFAILDSSPLIGDSQFVIF